MRIYRLIVSTTCVAFLVVATFTGTNFPVFALRPIFTVVFLAMMFSYGTLLFMPIPKQDGVAGRILPNQEKTFTLQHCSGAVFAVSDRLGVVEPFVHDAEFSLGSSGANLSFLSSTAWA
ncbi:hypothetical protein [Paracoccus benzoatiresistens]|uniref:Uncharacterized protein n=1 Tax=Paracoccus benzoatiresistens TaxID=2997341 RepID=A0ABT4JC42_9RHOB|nr:hypothetical protein [Paracoccus sp. EF6]MCZ0963908.1 hypothetical protein [Paracoccus sp. EF6]